MAVEAVVFIKNIGDSPAHAGREVLTGFTQDDGNTAGHVFKTMVTTSFADRPGAAVADTEALARDAGKIGGSACRAIQCHVAGDDVLIPGKTGFFLRPDDDLSAGEALADIVVGIAIQAQRQSGWNESTE